MTPIPPRNRYAKVTASKARRLIAELKAASRTCSGENSSDCGSEISGQPAKTLGVHHGHSPRANEVARNCTCGKNCDLASHGIVTAPDSHGQAGSRKASAKIAIVAASGTRALAVPAASRAGLPAPDHADGDTSPSARVSGSRLSPVSMPSPHCGAVWNRAYPILSGLRPAAATANMPHPASVVGGQSSER